MKPLGIFASLLFSAFLNFAYAQEDTGNVWRIGDDSFRLNGFASVGVSWLKQNDAIAFGQVTSEPNWKWPTKFGIQGQYQHDSFAFTAQAVARGKEDFKAEFSRAYLSYSPNDSVSLRIGRLGIPARFGSGYRDVAMAYPWPMSQVEMYNVIDTGKEGIDALIKFPVSDWNMLLRPYLMRNRDDKGIPGTAIVDRVYGLSMTLSKADELSIYANLAKWNTRVNNWRQLLKPVAVQYFQSLMYQQAYDGLRAQGIPESTASQLAQAQVLANTGAIGNTVDTILAEPFFDDQNGMTTLSLGFSYEKNDWLVIGEYQGARTQRPAVDTYDWNITLGRYFDNTLFYFEYAKAPPGSIKSLWTPQNPANFPYQTAINDYMRQAGSNGLRIFALGMAHSFRQGWDVKTEWRRTYPDRTAFFLFDRQGGQWLDKPVDQFTITLNYVF